MIANTPSLWSVINVWDHPMIRTMALERSKTWPLTVLCYHTIVLTDRPVPSSRTRPFFTALLPHINRWKYIYIGEVQSVADLKEFLALPAPMIETFEIGRGRYGVYHHKIDYFAGQAPRLQRVFIMGPGIKWEWAVLRGLKFLTLSRLGQHPNPTRILQILLNCPLLETLKISAASRGFYPQPQVFEDVDIDPIILPNLKKLKIVNVFLELLCVIARNICAPNCFDVNLSTHRTYHPAGDDGITHALKGALTHFIPTIKSRLSERGELRFSVAGIALSGGFKPTIRAKFAEGGSHLPALFQWLYENCQPFHSATLELTHGSYASSGEAQWALERLSFVTRLRVDLEYDPEELLDFLAAPIVRDGVARWPFPSLRWLDIATNGDRVDVLPMIERRYVVRELQVVQGNIVVTSTERPAKLEHLRVDTVWKDEYSALFRLLGVGVLQVDVDPESDEE